MQTLSAVGMVPKLNEDNESNDLLTCNPEDPEVVRCAEAFNKEEIEEQFTIGCKDK